MEQVKWWLFSLLIHGFIILTGIAAFPHTVWSVSTISNGTEPGSGSLGWWLWLIPGIAFGLTIDAGMIAVSTSISRGNRNRWMYVVFGFLAFCTFYLQWYYAATHVDIVPLGRGVNANVRSFSEGLRDANIWLLPFMLPAATFIYTFGFVPARRNRNAAITYKSQAEIRVERPAEIPTTKVPALPVGQTYTISCPECDWIETYDTKRGASNGLVSHKRWNHNVVKQHSNGRHE